MTEQNGSNETPGGSPNPRQTGNRYDATAAAERRRDSSGGPSDQAMAEAIGAGSPQDVGQSTRASTHGPIKQTVGEGRPESGDVTFPAFDDHRPPDKGLIDDCVHCGFCLPTCPTYVLFGEEMDSPRGRIYLMNKGLNEESMNDTMVRHFDLCLGCMACVTACPSGVQYDKLIEATRAQVERNHERTPADRLLRATIFSVFPHPRLFRRSGLLQRLTPRLAAMESLTPRLSAPERVAERTPATGPRRAVVAMLT